MYNIFEPTTNIWDLFFYFFIFYIKKKCANVMHPQRFATKCQRNFFNTICSACSGFSFPPFDPSYFGG